MSKEYIEIAIPSSTNQDISLIEKIKILEGKIVFRTKTSRNYCFDKFNQGIFKRNNKEEGSSFDIDIWRFPKHCFGDFLDSVPPSLLVGSVSLEDGKAVKAILSEKQIK